MCIEFVLDELGGSDGLCLVKILYDRLYVLFICVVHMI